MTREEAIQYNKNLREYMRITDKKSEYKFLEENYIALEMAIKALEQEPCNDAVSRAEVLNLIRFNAFHVESQVKAIENMPSVTPQEPRIGKLIGYIDFLRNTAQGKKKSLNLLEKVVKGELEDIRAEGENFVKPRTGEWIPVSERLPEESTVVLVWCPERKNIYCAYYEEKCWWIFGACFAKLTKVTLKVVAWMPLPQPCKEVE